MTANGTANSFSARLSLILHGLRRAGRFFARVALGSLAILAAGIVALAMAGLGLLIALAALIYRFTHRPSHKPQADPVRSSEDGITLEARQTGRGWTVE